MPGERTLLCHAPIYRCSAWTEDHERRNKRRSRRAPIQHRVFYQRLTRGASGMQQRPKRRIPVAAKGTPLPCSPPHRAPTTVAETEWSWMSH